MNVPSSAFFPTDGAQADAKDARSKPALLQYWEMVARHKTVVIAILLFGIAASILLTVLMTEQYTARARVEVKREQEALTDVSEGRGQSMQDLEFYQTQYSLLEAESLAARVVRDLRLLNDAKFVELYKLNEVEGATQSASRTEREQRAAKILLDSVSIQPIRGSRLIDIYFTSPDPELSSRIVNSWVEQFVQASFDRRFGATVEARNYLQRRLDELRDRLEESERQSVNYAANNDILNIRTDQDATGQTRSSQTLVSADLEALNRELAAATAARIQAQSQLQQQGANRSTLDNTAINSLRERRGEIAADLAKLLTQFEPGYPPARALQSQLDALDRSIAAEERRVLSSTNNEYRQASEREALLRNRVAGLKSQFNAQERRTIQFNIYQREVDTNRELYNSLLQRYKEVGVAGVGLNNIAIVDPAKPPKTPSSPRPIINLMIGLIIASLIAAAAVLALEQVDETLNDGEDVRRQLGIPLIGAIPAMDDEDILEAVQDQKSMAFEAYISLATNLNFATDHGVPRILSLTSTRPDEGKSTSAIALSHVLARTRGSVVLVDSDMRNPSLHKELGLPSQAGLSNYLSGDNNLDTLVQGTKTDRLFMMAAGPIPPNAAELLTGDRLQQLLAQLRTRFDYVVLDCPPVLGLADSPLIARSTEATLFVLEAGGAGVRGVQTALARVRSSGANIVGVILTKVSGKSSPYGDRYGYGYGYGASAN